MLPPIDATDSLGFVTLMLAKLIKSFGGMVSIRWVIDGVSFTKSLLFKSSFNIFIWLLRQCITEGTLCVAQGYLKQIGDVGDGLL